MSKTQFKNFLNESIVDKAILKAIFVIGLPGAGKSYTIKHLSGTISPKVVNTDKATEFISKKLGIVSNSENWNDFKDSSLRITKASLFNYVNGLLPLFIDGTSNDISNILHRIGILESLGYDIGIVFIDTPLDVAIQRAQNRVSNINRYVDIDFIKSVNNLNTENAEYLKSKVDFFVTVNNQSDEIGNKELQHAFKVAQSFFSEDIKNPIGKRLIEDMHNKKEKYLCPNIISENILNKKIDGWYKQ